MKWVQLKDELDTDGVRENERKELFKEYKTEKELKAALQNKKKFEVWVSYPLPNGISFGKKARRKYEVFCGAFLYYHDIIFKKYPEGAGYEYPKIEGPGIAPTWKKYSDKNFYHEIYFEWLPEGKGKKKTSVTIHITPTPPEFNSSPPPPPKPPPPEST